MSGVAGRFVVVSKSDMNHFVVHFFTFKFLNMLNGQFFIIQTSEIFVGWLVNINNNLNLPMLSNDIYIEDPDERILNTVPAVAPEATDAAIKFKARMLVFGKKLDKKKWRLKWPTDTLHSYHYPARTAKRRAAKVAARPIILFILVAKVRIDATGIEASVDHPAQTTFPAGAGLVEATPPRGNASLETRAREVAPYEVVPPVEARAVESDPRIHTSCCPNLNDGS